MGIKSSLQGSLFGSTNGEQRDKEGSVVIGFGLGARCRKGSLTLLLESYPLRASRSHLGPRGIEPEPEG
jgi:hypothetical protein